MRKIKNIILMMSALVLGACQSTADTAAPEIPEGKGQLKSSFLSDEVLNDVITITISQGETVVEKWNDLNDIPEVISLVPGKYTITAKTEGEMPQVSDKPYYNANADFSIVEGEVAYVALACKILNMKVSVELSETLQAEFPDWQADFFYLDTMDTYFTSLTADDNNPIYIAPAAFGITLSDVTTAESRTVIFEEYGAAMYHNVKFE